VRQLAWAFAFLVFDREAGKPRPATVTGLVVVILTIASHQVMSGPWLLQVGFSTPSPVAASTGHDDRQARCPSAPLAGAPREP
jgi:hypothetical protein